jgi:hypothetical protein
MTDASGSRTNGREDGFEPQDTVNDTVLAEGLQKCVSSRFGSILLGLMAAFFLFVNLAMCVGVRFEGLLVGLVLGVIAAEITLCAMFSALGPFPVFVRVTIGMAGAIVVCLAIFRLGGAGSDERLEISAAAFFQWIAVQIPLWFFRLRSGWCLRRTSSDRASFMRQDLQFGIRQLMAWTAVVALLLSIAKLTIPDDSLDQSRSAVVEIITITLILVVFNSLAAWPMIWAAFVRSRMLTWCGVAVACSAILGAAEQWAFVTLIGGVIPGIFIALHAIQLVAVGGSLLLVRLNGVRLVRDADHDHVILQSDKA